MKAAGEGFATRRVRRTLLAACGLLALASVFGGSASPSGAQKSYGATISPASVAVGSTQTYALTISNASSGPYRLGSANIAIPAGYGTVVLGSTAAPPGKTWTAALVAGVIRLRTPRASDALAPGESVALGVTAAAHCPETVHVWSTDAKQSSDFNGTGNGLTRVGPEPAVSSAGSCHAATKLAFVTPPRSLIAGGLSDLLTVGLQDAGGAAVSAGTGGVLVQLSTSSTGGEFRSSASPATAITAVTIPDGSSTATFRYTDAEVGSPLLTASSAGLASAAQTETVTSTVTVACPSTGCSATASGPSTTASVAVPAGGSGGNLDVTLTSFADPTFCGGPPPVGSVTTVVPPAGYTAANPITVTIVYAGVTGPKTTCKDSGPGTPFAPLPDCSSSLPPCVALQHQSGSDLEVVLKITSADPAIGTH